MTFETIAAVIRAMIHYLQCDTANASYYCHRCQFCGLVKTYYVIFAFLQPVASKNERRIITFFTAIISLTKKLPKP